MTSHFLSGYHVILDPAGDNKHVGRSLATCYERSVTLQICDAIKKKLAEEVSSWQVTITHSAGESLTQEQRAQIANKSNADLFIHISCFEDTRIKPHIMSYYYACNTPLRYKPEPYILIPAYKAHELQFSMTEKIVTSLSTHLQKQGSVYTVSVPYAIPDSRLAYIKIPSCTLEIGVSHAFPWVTAVDPLYKALIACIESTSSI